MNNKPKYTIFNNAKYAIEGFVHAFKSETSFKIELFLAPFIYIAIFLFDFDLSYKLILFVTYTLVMITELLNSAVENVVDLVTLKKHPLAKAAKDIGATAVLFSVLLHISCWLIVLFDFFK